MENFRSGLLIHIYVNLLAEVLRDTDPDGWREVLSFAYDLSTKDNILIVFTAAIGQLPPDEWQDRLHEVRTILSERGFSLGAADMTQIIVKPCDGLPRGTFRGLVSGQGSAGRVRHGYGSEAENPGKVSDQTAPYYASPGKMTQRRLFD